MKQINSEAPVYTSSKVYTVCTRHEARIIMPRFTPPPPLLEKGVAWRGMIPCLESIFYIFARDAKLPSWETRVDSFNAVPPGFDFFSKWKFLGRSSRENFLYTKLEITLIEIIFTLKFILCRYYVYIVGRIITLIE